MPNIILEGEFKSTWFVKFLKKKDMMVDNVQLYKFPTSVRAAVLDGVNLDQMGRGP